MMLSYHTDVQKLLLLTTKLMTKCWGRVQESHSLSKVANQNQAPRPCWWGELQMVRNCSSGERFWSWWIAASCQRGESQKVCVRDGRGRQIAADDLFSRATDTLQSALVPGIGGNVPDGDGRKWGWTRWQRRNAPSSCLAGWKFSSSTGSPSSAGCCWWQSWCSASASDPGKWWQPVIHLQVDEWHCSVVCHTTRLQSRVTHLTQK